MPINYTIQNNSLRFVLNACSNKRLRQIVSFACDSTRPLIELYNDSQKQSRCSVFSLDGDGDFCCSWMTKICCGDSQRLKQIKMFVICSLRIIRQNRNISRKAMLLDDHNFLVLIWAQNKSKQATWYAVGSDKHLLLYLLYFGAFSDLYRSL